MVSWAAWLSGSWLSGRCLFEVVFEARFGRRKNRPKKPKKTQKAIFLSRAPVYGTCLGRDYREGKHENLMRHLQQGVRCWCLVFDVGVVACCLARRAPPSVGGGLNSPRGGPPPPPHLCARMLGDCHALKACICRTALLKAHGEMKAHILATICPDFAMNLRRW